MTDTTPVEAAGSVVRRRVHGSGIDSVSLIASSAANSGLGLAFWMLAARLYPTESVGRATTLIGAGTIIASLANLSLGAMYERFLSSSGRSARKLIGRGHLLALTCSTLAGGAFVLVDPVPDLIEGRGQALVFVGSVVALSAFALEDSVLIGLGGGRWAALKNVWHALAKLAVMVGLAASGSGFAIIAAWVLPALLAVGVVSVLVALGSFTRDARWREPARLPAPRALVGYFATSYGWVVAQAIPGLVVPTIVARRLGLDDVAHFNIAWMIVGASTMLMSLAGGPFVAAGSRPGADLGGLVRPFIRLIAAMSVGRAVLVAGFGPLALLVYGGDYATAGTPLLLAMGFAHSLSGPAFLYGALAKINREIVYPASVQASGVLLLCGGTWLMVGSHGLTGVAWAYLIHEVAVLAAASVPLRRLLRRALQPVSPEPVPDTPLNPGTHRP
jgi:O-antigen/teichoic acid export membrane protein